nr:perlucin-like isoform X2 [Procambarus clarkii]
MFIPVLLVISLLTQVDAGTCPTLFVPVGEGCYHFSEVTKTWAEARDYCQTLLPDQDADLAVLDNYCDDYMHLITYITSNGLINSYWLGATDQSHENYYIWVDGRVMNLLAPYWAPAEPQSSTVYDCIVLHDVMEVTTRLRLMDYNCNNEYLFICQLGVHTLKLT